jgi:PAS domain S-box-containing protein
VSAGPGAPGGRDAGIAPIAILLVAPTGRVDGSNARARALLGRAAEQLHGRHVDEILRRRTAISPATAGRGEVLAIVGREAEVTVRARRLPLARSEPGWTAWLLDPEDDDSPESTIATAEARDAFERGERLYRAVFDQSYQATWVLSADAAILAANRRALALMGRRAESAVGCDASEVAFPRASEASRAALEIALAAIDRPDPTQLTIEDVDAAGSPRVHEATVRAVTGPDARPLFLVLEARDITERRRDEAELVSARLAAEAADRAKSAFLARMSHEIRTPLHAVLGFARLLLERSSPASEAHEPLRAIEQAGERLLALIEDVLDLARIEAGGMAVAEAPADMALLFDELGRRFGESALAKGLAFEADLPDDLPAWLYLDEAKLRRVLGDLLDNAVKYSEQGTVRLVAAWEPAGLRDRLVIEVSDTGPGIEDQALRRLFRPFEAAAPSRAQGTGLGLALAHRLVRLMGGKLRVDSQPARGTRIQVEVPARPVEGLEGFAAVRAKPHDADRPAHRSGLARLSALAPELRDELERAAETADFARLERAVERAVEAEPELGPELTATLDHFDYRRLLDALGGPARPAPEE